MFAVSHVRSCAWKFTFHDFFWMVIAECYMHLEFLETEHPPNGEIEIGTVVET